MAADIRNRLDPHWSTWTLLSEDEARYLAANEHRRFFTRNRRGEWQETRGRVVGSTDPWVCLERVSTDSSRKVRSSGGTATARSTAEEAGRDAMTPEEAEAVRQYQEQREGTRTDHTLRLEYLDDQGEPVPDIRYTVSLNGTDYTGRLNDNGRATLSNLPAGEASIVYEADQSRLPELRQELKSLLDNIIDERSDRKDMMNDLLAESGYVEQGLILTGAFMVSFWDSAKELASDTADLVTGAADGLTAASAALYEKLADGYSLDELEDDFAYVVSEAGHAWDQAEKAYTVLKWLATDDETWSMLVDFPKRFFDSMSTVEKVEALGALAFDILFAIALAVATALTAGAAAAVAGSAAAIKYSRYFTETIGTLRSIYRMLPTGLIEKRYKQVRVRRSEQDHTGRSDEPQENLNQTSEDTTNSDSKTENDQTTQCEARSTCRNDPINMLTGEELFSHVDFELGGPLPLVWKRLYRSTASGRRSDLGHGWSHPFDQSMALKDGQLVHRDAEGAYITFPLPEDGKRVRNQWGTVLSRYGDYISLRQDGVVLNFEPDPHQPDQWRLSHLSTTDRKHRWELRYTDTHPGQGVLTQATASWGALLRFEHGKHGWHRITGRASPHLPVTTLAHYRIDRHGDLIAARDQSGQQEQYRYAHHLFQLRQTATGLHFGFEWDATTPDARCTRQYEEGGHYDYRFQWTPENRTSTATDGRGFEETFVFDAEGNLIEQTRPDGTVERWEFDSHSRLRAHTDPLGNTTRFDYDRRDRLVKRTDALGHTVRLHYWNDSPQPSQIIDPLGQRTHYDYTPDGQLTAVRHPDGTEERWTHHGDRLIGHQDRQGRQHRYHWHDTLGTLSRYECLTERDDEPGTLTTLADITFEYDDQGRLHTQTDQHGRQQHFQYDDHGRLITQLDEHNRAWRFDYDRAGRLVRQTDPSGRTTELRYGVFAQPEARVLPNGTEIRYEYDAERNLTAVINGNGQAHRFDYDGCERLIKEVGVDGRTTEYAYNDAGHLTDLHEGPIHATFDRNALGQLIREQYQHAERAEANTWAEYQYDELGRLTKARNEHAEQNLTYDAAGRLQEDEIEQIFPGWMNQARPYRHWQHYHYNERGQLHSVAHSALVARPPNQKWPSLHHDFRQPGWRQHYDWHTDGTLKRIGVNLPGDPAYADTPILEQRFNDLGLLTERREGAHTSHWEYDPEQRLQRYRRLAQNDPDRPVQERAYGYDEAGRINRIHDKRHGERRYHYDALDQLTRTDIRHPDQDKAHTQLHNVDAAGNQLPDGLDRLLDNRLPFHGDRHFDYDEHGNLVHIRRGTGQKLEQRLSYNAKHQLIRIEDYKDGELQQRLTFRYDALGRRIDKAVQGWVTPDTKQDKNADEAEFKLRYREAYVWQGHTLIQVRHIGTNFMPKNNRVYFYEPGTHVPVALWDQKLGLHQIDTDHTGTPKAMYCHETGEEVWCTDHHTYGETRDSEAAMIHPVTGYSFEPGLRQQGQYEDIETGLYQNCYRFYDPGSGRYVSQDPIGLMGGLNVYQYCPNPVNYVDPLGLSTKECDKDEAARSGIPNISDIGKRISNKQLRHIKDRQEWINRGQGGYLNSMEDAQSVLTAAHNGEAEFLGSNAQGFPVIRYNDITGYNNNPGAGYSDQPTNVFVIKGTAKPSIVPTNPNWSPN
ncbi:DUF6531 domain-containing protein [Saccharospirillum salsuginis]|uniref:RHS repeat-associated core domain-containing protein n=1 Tax=Saccharospirillum salsuginis TaxID=418750 RepID=A0A918KMH4_9GAMM|nr:DUF6531 domain-containing protein [Saccharospirillum salsuginis]GGX68918.1 hypothetical protein GCM10007392_40720 [Saccharospirillum salsuginis]